jgi:hypothetical protein
VTLNDDESATMASWEIDDVDAMLYRQMLTDDLDQEPDESVYTTEGVEAINQSTGPGQVIVL